MAKDTPKQTPRATPRETPNETTAELRTELRVAWQRYVDLLAPIRPALHGYCRRLTNDLWDAEDLVQDTLVKGFGHLGMFNRDVGNPRAYLLRIATNLWIDEVRRREARGERATAEELADTRSDPADGTRVREAGAQLMQRLSPQERAAILLKEVFEMSLDEIADLLSTSTGAVKAALHNARGRLRDANIGVATQRPRPSAALIDRFADLYAKRDLEGLAAMMLDSGTVENVGQGIQRGVETFREPSQNILAGVVFGHDEWPGALDWSSRRIARFELDGEPMAGMFIRFRGEERLMTAMRFEEREGRIARLRIYGFCPETMREVAERLGVPVLTGIYRPPLPAGSYE